jgi:hypothetical protein
LGWNAIVLPYKKKLDNALTIGVDVCIVAGHMIYGQLLTSNLEDETIKAYGSSIYFILMSSNWILMAGMLVTTAISLVQWIQKRCKRKKGETPSDITQDKILDDEKTVNDQKDVKVQNFITTTDVNDSKEELFKRSSPKKHNKNRYLKKKPDISYIKTDRENAFE